PLSASMALGMLLNGAAGDTYDEIRDMTGFAGMTLTEVNEAYHGLLELLVDLDPSVEVRLANSVWHREGFTLSPAFSDTVRERFEAELAGLDFDSPDAAATINAWVEERTNGRIDGIVESPIDPAAMLFLLNAVYFNAPWTEAFDPDRTAPRDFTLADGSVVQVPTMVREEDGGPLSRAGARRPRPGGGGAAGSRRPPSRRRGRRGGRRRPPAAPRGGRAAGSPRGGAAGGPPPPPAGGGGGGGGGAGPRGGGLRRVV